MALGEFEFDDLYRSQLATDLKRDLDLISDLACEVICEDPSFSVYSATMHMGPNFDPGPFAKYSKDHCEV